MPAGPFSMNIPSSLEDSRDAMHRPTDDTSAGRPISPLHLHPILFLVLMVSVSLIVLVIFLSLLYRFIVHRRKVVRLNTADVEHSLEKEDNELTDNDLLPTAEAIFLAASTETSSASNMESPFAGEVIGSLARSNSGLSAPDEPSKPVKREVFIDIRSQGNSDLKISEQDMQALRICACRYDDEFEKSPVEISAALKNVREFIDRVEAAMTAMPHSEKRSSGGIATEKELAGRVDCGVTHSSIETSALAVNAGITSSIVTEPYPLVAVDLKPNGYSAWPEFTIHVSTNPCVSSLPRTPSLPSPPKISPKAHLARERLDAQLRGSNISEPVSGDFPVTHHATFPSPSLALAARRMEIEKGIQERRPRGPRPGVHPYEPYISSSLSPIRIYNAAGSRKESSPAKPAPKNPLVSILFSVAKKLYLAPKDPVDTVIVAVVTDRRKENEVQLLARTNAKNARRTASKQRRALAESRSLRSMTKTTSMTEGLSGIASGQLKSLAPRIPPLPGPSSLGPTLGLVCGASFTADNHNSPPLPSRGDIMLTVSMPLPAPSQLQGEPQDVPRDVPQDESQDGEDKPQVEPLVESQAPPQDPPQAQPQAQPCVQPYVQSPPNSQPLKTTTSSRSALASLSNRPHVIQSIVKAGAAHLTVYPSSPPGRSDACAEKAPARATSVAGPARFTSRRSRPGRENASPLTAARNDKQKKRVSLVAPSSRYTSLTEPTEKRASLNGLDSPSTPSSAKTEKPKKCAALVASSSPSAPSSIRSAEVKRRSPLATSGSPPTPPSVRTEKQKKRMSAVSSSSSCSSTSRDSSPSTRTPPSTNPELTCKSGLTSRSGDLKKRTSLVYPAVPSVSSHSLGRTGNQKNCVLRVTSSLPSPSASSSSTSSSSPSPIRRGGRVLSISPGGLQDSRPRLVLGPRSLGPAARNSSPRKPTWR